MDPAMFPTERKKVLSDTMDLAVLFDVFPHLNEECLGLVIRLARADLFYGSDYVMERKGTSCIIRSRIGIDRARYDAVLRNMMKEGAWGQAMRAVLLIFNGLADASYRLGV
jgi:hypothetical protein